MSRVSRAGVLAAYRDGVTVICELAAKFTDATWLAATPDAPGPEHITAFADSARSYGRRLPLSWDLPHHRYRGTDVTVGAMAGAACAEWHLHAWDLARSLGKDYRPANPELVLTVWRAGMPQLWPVLTGWDGDDPWRFLLTASGRDPGWLQVLVESLIRDLRCKPRPGGLPGAERRLRLPGRRWGHPGPGDGHRGDLGLLPVRDR